MSRRHVYVNGPMSGPISGRMAAFQQATAALREHGYLVTNPVESAGGSVSDQDCLRADIQAMLRCDTVAVLPGWQQSADSKLLMTIAARLGMRLLAVSALLKRDPVTP